MMNAKVQSAIGDKFKWLAAILLIAAAVVGNIYFADQSLLYRVIGVVVMVGFALAAAAYTRHGVAFVEMLKQARIEMKKVVWPTRQETTQTTLVVVAVVLVMSLILWGLDSFLGFLVSGLIG